MLADLNRRALTARLFDSAAIRACRSRWLIYILRPDSLVTTQWTMDPQSARRLVRQMFDLTAPRYVECIDPAFKPLAERLVRFAALKPTQRVLDLGTGTGLAAIAAAPHVAYVVGLDYSMQLLEKAHAKLAKLALTNVALVQGDMHALSFAGETFDAVMGAFSFNSTDPARVFPEAFRVLVAGGQLTMQEWGVRDEASEIVSDAVAEYAVDDPSPPLAALREALSTPDAWDALEGIDDLIQALEGAGFREVRVDQETPSVHFETTDAFLRYKLAWTSRYAEVQAVPEEVRGLLYGELYDRLEPHCAEDGSLNWQPEIVRVRASKAAR